MPRLGWVTDLQQLSAQDARRIAVRAQLLDGDRPTELTQVLHHLAAVQVDGTKSVAPSADLVLWSRLGSSYSTAHLAASLAEHRVVDLRGILRAIRLSRATMRNIRQNLFFAFVYNTLGVPVAAGILYPFFGILLSPMIAAAAMSLSSVSVIGNALRLRQVNLDA